MKISITQRDFQLVVEDESLTVADISAVIDSAAKCLVAQTVGAVSAQAVAQAAERSAEAYRNISAFARGGVIHTPAKA